MCCAFPVIKSAIDDGRVSLQYIAEILDEDINTVKKKLCGKDIFDINEAMTINNEIFPDIPFKELFSPTAIVNT